MDAGPMPLTPREQEVFQLLQQQLANEQIEALLRISENTLKSHIKHIRAKTGALRRPYVPPASHT